MCNSMSGGNVVDGFGGEPDVVDVHVVYDTVLCLTFVGGVVKLVDVKPFMVGGGFDEVFSLGLFDQVSVDVESGTVVWPNGMDIAPEVLFAAEDIRAKAYAQLQAVSDEDRAYLRELFKDFVEEDNFVGEPVGESENLLVGSEPMFDVVGEPVEEMTEVGLDAPDTFGNDFRNM